MTKQTPEDSPTQPEKYYAVISSEKPKNIEERIFTSIEQVNIQMKTLRRARFKSFPNIEEAIDYVSSVQCDSPIDVLVSDFERLLYFEPGGREYNELKRNIEKGDLHAFTSKVNKNPRFIINSYDLPPIIQRGFRYNIAHLASIHNQIDILKFVFDSIESGVALRRLYPGSGEEEVRRKAAYLMECYLNTPEKGNHETPLHLAAKFGNSEMVSFLVAHPKTDKTRRNKQNLSAKEVVCSRANPEDADKVRELFEAEFFVALVNEGEMCSPRLLSPLKLNSSNGLSPQTRIRGLVGPIPSDTAKYVTRLWREDVRTRRGDINSCFHRTGRDISDKLNISWMEFWTFLDSYADLRSPTGLALTEHFFLQRVLTFLLPRFLPLPSLDLDDLSSLSSHDSFVSCLSDLPAFSPYDKYPQLYSWSKNSLSNLRFSCCRDLLPPDGAIHVYFNLPLPNIDHLTELTVGLRSSICLVTETALVGAFREMLLSWCGLIGDEPSVVYRCRHAFSVLFALNSVCEIVLWHEREEMRLHFPLCGGAHRMVLFCGELRGGGDAPCFIGGSESSVEDFDAFDVLGKIHFDCDVYPLIHRWMEVMRRVDYL